MYTVKLPSRFIIDHIERCGADEGFGICTVVRETKRYVVAEMDDEGLADLLSDCDYYSEEIGFDFEYFGLCGSARATADAIAKQIGKRWGGVKKGVIDIAKVEA